MILNRLRRLQLSLTDAYEQLFEKDEVAIGEYIELDNINYKVIGVFETR